MSLHFGRLLVQPNRFEKPYSTDFTRFEKVNRDLATGELARENPSVKRAWENLSRRVSRDFYEHMEDTERVINRIEGSGYHVHVYGLSRIGKEKDRYYVRFATRSKEEMDLENERTGAHIRRLRQESADRDAAKTPEQRAREKAELEALVAYFKSRVPDISPFASVETKQHAPSGIRASYLPVQLPDMVMAFPLEDLHTNFSKSIEHAYNYILRLTFVHQGLVWPGVLDRELAEEVSKERLEALKAGRAEFTENELAMASENGRPKDNVTIEHVRIPSLISVISRGSSANNLTLLHDMYKDMCKYNPNKQDSIQVYYPDEENLFKDMCQRTGVSVPVGKMIVADFTGTGTGEEF